MTSPDSQTVSRASDPPPTAGSGEARPTPPRGRHLFRRLAIAALILVVVAGTGLIGAEYHTSRPAFCGSCHIMDPYYRSWEHDKHGAKVGVRCVDCHYAPGEQHTFQAKFKGLSQVTSYFSGRAGASRPRAHVNNASCLTSRCHGDQEYLNKPLLIGEVRTEKRLVGTQETEVRRAPTVTFVHDKHLNVQLRLSENEAQVETIRARLRQALPPDALERIEVAARSIQAAQVRAEDLRAALHQGQVAAFEADALELMRLEHEQTRLRQLAGLNCAACHSYDASGQHHVMLADLDVCFTCHFNNQAFNRDTGECLKCHEPPARKILIHDQGGDLRGPETPLATSAPGAPVLMDHRDIVSRGINCASCHLDVIQGQATVAARDCTHCHDQASYLEGFETRDTRTVAEYHRVHVASQRARCADCHHVIQHRLVDPTHIGTSSGFLEPVLNDCQHCHPNHHRQQVELLMGTGGAGLSRPMPNAMFGSRLNCIACHIRPATDLKGDELIRASEATCIACHGDDYARLFEQWMNEIKGYLQEAGATLARVDQRVADLKARNQDLPTGAADRIARARTNIQLVQAGNGIHNKNFALAVLDLSIRDLDQAMGLLTANP